MPCAFTVSVYRATSPLLSVTSHFLVCAVWLAPETDDAIHVSTLHPYKGIKGCLFYTLWSGLGLTSTKGNGYYLPKGKPCPGRQKELFLSVYSRVPLTSKFFLCQSGAIRVAKPNISNMRDLDLVNSFTRTQWAKPSPGHEVAGSWWTEIWESAVL